jgi:hypothetical protein
MVCSIVCAPAITLLAWISDKIGLGHGVTGIFIGALIVWFSEVQSNMLFKIAEKKGKKYLFPFQTAIITILNLILFAWMISVWKLL